MRNYIWLLVRRDYLEAYPPPPIRIKTANNYAFLIASLWNYQECIQSTNRLRFEFAEMFYENSSINFEGGFVIHSLSAKVPVGWKKLCHTKRISVSDYINKTKKSFTVFNTPAVRECHGWKLPEFLSMGKAIISTPLLNDLTCPLIDGEDLLIVNNKKELKAAIESLLNDHHLRSKLEKAAQTYWNKIANPEAVIRMILTKI